MNALSLTNDIVTLTTTNKNALLITLLAFGCICVYQMIARGGWLAKLLGVGLLILAVHFLAACNGPIDPLGATSRTRLRTDAAVSIAQADEAARIAESNAKIITEQSKQNGATARTLAWASMIPFALMIVGVAVVLVIVVNWQGRIWYAKTIHAGPQPSQVRTLTATQVDLLQSYAVRTGKQLVYHDGEYFLTDGQTTVKALLKG